MFWAIYFIYNIESKTQIISGFSLAEYHFLRSKLNTIKLFIVLVFRYSVLLARQCSFICEGYDSVYSCEGNQFDIRSSCLPMASFVFVTRLLLSPDIAYVLLLDEAWWKALLLITDSSSGRMNQRYRAYRLMVVPVVRWSN